MSDPISNENRRALYLEQIDISTAKTGFRVNIQMDGRDIKMTHEQRTSIWTPNESLEILDGSKITVIIKTGHTYKGVSFGKLEVRIEVSDQQAIKSFWESMDSASSKDSISRSTTLGQDSVTVNFKFYPSKTLEDTRATVNRLQKEMKNFRAVMNVTTERHVDNTAKKDVTLAELNPMLNLALRLVKSIFNVSKEQRIHDNVPFDLTSLVDRILPFAKQALEEILEGDAELLEEVIRRVYDLIADTAVSICDCAKRGRAFQSSNPTVFTEEHLGIKTLHDNFALLEKDFDHAVGIEKLTLARKNEMDRLIRLLNPVREANYHEDHRCMEGTRTRLLDEISAWVTKRRDTGDANNTDADNVYWLYGMPGLGKTSVANSLCHRLQKSENLGGSFFCRRDNKILRDQENIIPTLISKLATTWAPYRTLVAKALLDDPQFNSKSKSSELFLRSLRELKKPPPWPLVLVLDALDECGQETTREGLLKTLFDASSQINWLKIVITSRPEHDIQSFFKARACPTRNLSEDDKARKDIRLFAQERMVSLAKRHNRQQGWPGKAHLGQMIQRSHGLFIYIETMYRILKSLKNPDKILDLLLGEQQRDANTELHSLYLEALKLQIGEETELFGQIGRAIIATSINRPLSDESLASLISIDAAIVRAWVDVLDWAFYRDPSQEGGIRIRHLLILEFFTEISDPADLRVDPKLAHADLSLYCLRTMARELKFNICGLETSYLANTEIKDLDDRVRHNISTGLQYSCVYWADHLCADSDSPSEEVGALLNNFLTGDWPLYWLEVLSLTGNVPVAIQALRMINERDKKLDEQAQRQAEDVMQFVQTFSTPISISAPHIYVSALPFAPLESHLWRNVRESFPNLLNVCEGRMQNWSPSAKLWEGHSDWVKSVAYSPNGLFIASGSEDKTIRIWDATTGAVVGDPLCGHTHWVECIAYSPDGSHIASGSTDKTIRIWDAITGAAVGAPLSGHTSMVNSVSYSPNGRYIVSGSFDMSIKIWDATTGTVVGEPLCGRTSMVNSVAYSSSGQHIVAGSWDGIRIYDATTGVEVGKPLSGSIYATLSVAYSPNDKHIVSGSADKTLQIWDATTSVAVGEPLTLHTESVWSVSYSPNGRYIVSGSYDKTIRIWDAITGAAVGGPLRGHTGCVRSVAFSPNGQYIVSGSDDKTVRIWDTRTIPGTENSIMSGLHSISNALANTGILDLSPPTGPFSFAISESLIDSDGWLRCKDGLLLWIPKDSRNGLTSSAIMTIPATGSHRRVRFDFTHFRRGTLWTEICRGL